MRPKVAFSLSDMEKEPEQPQQRQQQQVLKETRSNEPSPELKEVRPVSRPELDYSPRKSSFASQASFYKESSTSETSLFEEPTSTPTCFKVCREVMRMMKSDKNFMFDYRLSAQEGELMTRLWDDPGVRQCFQHSKSFQLIDSAEYLLDNLERITNQEYTPTADVRLKKNFTEYLRFL
jgi:hypothetical protein